MVELTSYATGTPWWVDVSSPDLDRSIDFYTSLFGWDAQRDPCPEADGYTLFTLRGKNVAAASPTPGEGMPSVWTTYLATDDADATAADAKAAGGNVMMEPFDVLDAGRMTMIQDPTGAVVAPGRRAGTTARSSRTSRAASTGTSSTRATSPRPPASTKQSSVSRSTCRSWPARRTA